MHLNRIYFYIKSKRDFFISFSLQQSLNNFNLAFWKIVLFGKSLRQTIRRSVKRRRFCKLSGKQTGMMIPNQFYVKIKNTEVERKHNQAENPAKKKIVEPGFKRKSVGLGHDRVLGAEFLVYVLFSYFFLDYILQLYLFICR